MSDITEHGQRVIAALASEYGLSPGAVEQMARAVSRGGGTMAQFDISELGGSGQWMAGGMTMVGDMFNHGLKARVEGLCATLSNAMVEAAFFAAPQTLAGAAWWPDGLGHAAALGGQNQCRYAYFPDSRRIAFDPGNGQPVVLLDTLDNRIGGFSQQQSGPGDPFLGVSCSSQNGQFPLSSLPRVTLGGSAQTTEDAAGAAPAQEAPPAPVQQPEDTPEPQAASLMETQPVLPPVAPPPAMAAEPSPSASPAGTTDPDKILSAIARMAELRDAGILTDEEFSTKKRDLLARL
jgi:hypothetical protein